MAFWRRRAVQCDCLADMDDQNVVIAVIDGNDEIAGNGS